MQAPHIEIHFTGNHDGFALAFARLREALDKEQLDSAPRYNVELVFEEIVSNIINYGTADGRGLNVRVALEARADEIVLTFDDDGVPFDATAHAARPPSGSLDDRRLGGFGLLLVRRAASSLNYRRTEQGRNRLTVAVRRR
jgi:serine/threonine-protein kinase RsbW